MKRFMKVAVLAAMLPGIPVGMGVLLHHGRAPTATHVFVGGAGSGARVTRTIVSTGGEALHGEVDIALGARARRHIVEDVELDARGWLTRAQITVTVEPGGEAEARLTLDPQSGIVTAQAAGVTQTWRAPVNAPWVYAAPGAAGQEIPTPVAAWVTLRAAQAAPSVHQIDRTARRAWSVPREQIMIPTESGTTVVLGGDGADVDERFVERVRSTTYGITLVRAPRGETM